ncbi:MAG: HAD-IIB family hydrolase [Oscillospiraceae bacterium]|nr:HAD-IIB family hydrolase [Oscillospiraceae bacterium]
MLKTTMNEIRLIAFDLDGTLTQHKSPLEDKNRQLLDALRKDYSLLMVGAGQSHRIFHQMGEYPIDIIGNYGMQFCRYDTESKTLVTIYDEVVPCDRESVSKRITALREKEGYTVFCGDSVEFHASGCVTYPLLGTKAKLQDKLAFDPDRSIRRAIYSEVKDAFPDFTVFVGGTSSFDFAPAPYNKYFALDRFCKENGYTHHNVLYCGDDYGPGGNDEAIYSSDFSFVPVDDYTHIGEILREVLSQS